MGPFAKPLVSARLQTAGDLESPPAPTYPSHCDWTIRFIKRLSVQRPDFHRELMNHVKRLIFQTWLPAGRMAAAAWQRTDPWLQSSLCCDSQPATAAQNWKRYLGESVCLHPIQSNRCWPSPLSVVKSCWMMSSQIWGNWKLATCSVFKLKLHVSPKLRQRGPQKRGKRVHWVADEFSRNTLVLTGIQLTLQLQIHINGLSVWSVSGRITTAAEVSGQIGPGRWMVLKTSLHSYINRI